MRTTLDIDDDVLLAAKEIAASKRTSAGRVISDLARKGLRPAIALEARARNGFELLAGSEAAVTPQLIDDLLEESF